MTQNVSMTTSLSSQSVSVDRR